MSGNTSSSISWIEVGAVLRVPAILPGSRGIWCEWLFELEAGRKGDELSALAYRAWRQRWWRGDLRRGHRLYHFLCAAVDQAQANVSPAYELHGFRPMPLGAARGIVDKKGPYWQPGEAKRDEWLATLPLFEELAGQLVAVEIIAWRPGAPERSWVARGTYDVLGEPVAGALMHSGKPVRIYETPQRWNRAGGAAAPGCCVLDWGGAFGREITAFAPVLVADNVAAARALQRRIDRRRPRVQFVRSAAAT